MAAIQNLAVNSSLTAIDWARTGSGPELDTVVFEQSADNVTWSTLGAGSRLTNGWQIIGVNLPLNTNIYLRARGFYRCGYFNNSVSVCESVRLVYLTPPVADSLADPAIVSATGGWYVWFSGSGYQMGGPWSLGVSGTPVAADFDGDGYSDPAVIDNSGNWYVWLTSIGYQMGGPWNLGVLGTPVAADFDGDRYADPVMVSSSGAWRVWFTSLGYQMAGPWSLGVSGTPVAGDFDGDRYADPAMVDNTGAWRVWYTSLGYQMAGPWSLGVSGTPLAADFDGQ